MNEDFAINPNLLLKKNKRLKNKDEEEASKFLLNHWILTEVKGRRFHTTALTLFKINILVTQKGGAT